MNLLDVTNRLRTQSVENNTNLWKKKFSVASFKANSSSSRYLFIKYLNIYVFIFFLINEKSFIIFFY